MTEITLTADSELGTVEITITYTENVISLLRADVNGTRAVRLHAGTLPTTEGTGTLRITDYEPALAGLIQYRALGAGGELASDWISFPGEACRPRFTIPAVPIFGLSIDALTGYDATRLSRSTVHEIIGRDDPLVVQGRMRNRSGTMKVPFDTYAELLDLEAILERGQTMLYRQVEHAGLDLYFHATDLTQAVDEGVWYLSFSFVEVGFPLGDVRLDPLWTFARLAATGGTFEQVAADYQSFRTLSIGEARSS